MNANETTSPSGAPVWVGEFSELGASGGLGEFDSFVSNSLNFANLLKPTRTLSFNRNGGDARYDLR